MSKFNRVEHWQNIYETKDQKNFSWYQDKPELSLDLIAYLDLPKTAKIIDIGGGDTFLVDYLLDEGYENITVLDVSEKAIERAKERLGTKANQVNWIVQDVSTFSPIEEYDLWFDRAALHFLNTQDEIDGYLKALDKGTRKGSNLIVGTFSVDGPFKCSGIDITQYDEESLYDLFKDKFTQLKNLRYDHETPSGSIQNFVFSVLRKEL